MSTVLQKISLVRKLNSVKRIVSHSTVTFLSGNYNIAQKTRPNYSGHRSSGYSAYASNILNMAPILAATVLTGYAISKQRAENCGIIGVVGGNDDAGKYLMEGLTIMRNRGYVYSVDYVAIETMII